MNYSRLTTSFLILIFITSSLTAPHIAVAIELTQAQNDNLNSALITGGVLGVGALATSALSAIFKDTPIVGSIIDKTNKVLVGVMRKRFYDLIVDQIVNWIQGGGQPLFIQNWDAFLAGYANIVTGDIVSELGLGAVCRPFGIQLQLAVLQPPRFTRQISCTLDQIVGNMVNFYNNFRSGGFIAYRELWNPQNNFYGGLLLALNKKETRISDRRFAALQEAQAGNGFLGTRKCDANGRHCYITTPGMQIGAAAGKIVGSDIDYLLSIPPEEFAAYIAAISDAFINRLIREGVGGLQRVVVASVPPLGYIPEQPRGAPPCSGLSGDALNGCLTYQGITSPTIALTQETYLHQVNDTLIPLQAAQQTMLALQGPQQTLVTRLNDLYLCQSGRGNQNAGKIGEEVSATQRTLLGLTQALVDLEKITIPLTNAKTKLEKGPITNPAALHEIISNVYQSFNKEQAEAYQQDIQEKYNALLPTIYTRLPEVQQQLQQCAHS